MQNIKYKNAIFSVLYNNKIELTLNFKVYQIKVVLEVDLHDIRKNTNPIWQKTDVYFSRYLTPTWPCGVFSKSS